MAKNDYRGLSGNILELVGGKDNVVFVTHCMTRLRLDLKDKESVKTDDIKNLVLGAQWVGNQLQIVIGPDVDNVYDELCSQGGFERNEKINENVDAPKKFRLKDVFDGILGAVSGTMVPLIPALVGMGLLSGILAIFGPTMLNLVHEGTNLYRIWTMASQAGFCFLPILIGYSGAKKFGCNPAIAMVLGAILVYPEFTAIVTAQEAFSVYGIPMTLFDYQKSVIPMILITWAYSYLEKLLNRIVPKPLRMMIVPLVSIIIMLPIALCVLGPLGAVVGNLFSAALIAIYNFIGPLGTGIIGALFIPLVSTGMHVAMNQLGGMQWYINKVDYMYFPAVYASCYALMGVCIGYLIKVKSKESKSLGASCFISQAVAAISEPAIFGILFANKKLFAAQIIGGLAGGIYMGLAKVGWYVPTPANIFMGVLSFAGGTAGNLMHGIIACVIAFAVSMVLSIIFASDKKEQGA